MSAVVDKIERILTEAYSPDNYVALVTEVFDKLKIVAPTYIRKDFPTNFAAHIVGYSHVANYLSPDEKKIVILSVELQKQLYVENSRSTQRSLAKKLIESANADAALVAFYTQGDQRWRLSFVRLDYELKIENGKLKAAENITPAKRYSFLVGKDEPCHTAIERLRLFLEKHDSNPTLDDLENAFSVEAVTKEFFELYCEKYHQLREALEKNADFVEEAKLHNFTSVQFAKKLMGQIVFLYFLQKKGWLGVKAWPRQLNAAAYKKAFYSRGAKSRELIPAVYTQIDGDTYRIDAAALNAMSDEDETFLSTCVHGEPWGTGPHNFMRRLFETSEKRGANFFDDFLEPLFYDALNVNRGEQGYDPALHCRIPFLSGGLFEPIDGYDWKHNHFAIPNELFSNKKDHKDRLADGILDIFDRYNFTMSEDEPLEREVAIDPEMLGKVFENLLDVNDRKSKGAFYTPREIVHYMCQESLINYLTNTMRVSETAIRDFILYGDFMKDEDASVLRRAERGDTYELWISEELYQLNPDGTIKVDRMAELDKALQDVRVADPAVGSGAFPLGMLNEIVRARQNITTYMDISQRILDPKGASREIRYRRINERSARQLKYDTIRNCIFAVDIEPSAVDIAQLRLWLALVIDDEVDPNALTALDGHRNPLPLPNLECNILCGNSLIDEFEGIQLINQSEIIGTAGEGKQTNLYQSAFDAALKRLIEKQAELFACDNTEKKMLLLADIDALRDSVIMSQIQDAAPETLDRYYAVKSLASKPFILWHLDFARVFREKGGFDIVIGNPPYLKEIDYKEIFDTIHRSSFGKKYGEGKMNFWYFFFHKGIDILRQDGFLSFIAPNYYVAGSGASKLNSRLINECTIYRYLDFNKTKVFSSADVQCMVFVVGKTTPRKKRPFKAYIFKHSIEREMIGGIINSLDRTDSVRVVQVGDQHDILLPDGKINFENVQYASLLSKIEKHTPSSKLFKSTQGIVENPSFLNKKNIESIKKAGYDVSNYAPGDYVFVIPRNKVGELGLSEEEKSLLRAYHEPNEIKRYYCEDTFKNYLLYCTKETLPDIELMPNVKRHLVKYKPFMEQRRETQSGSIKWFQLHWPRKEELFVNEKVVYPQMGARPTFAYSNKPFFTNMSANIVYSLDRRVDLKVMTCVLNSELAHFWLLHRAKNRGIGLDIAVSVIDKFPIDGTIFSDDELKRISAEIIQNAKDQDTVREKEAALNARVYYLYEVDESEVASIQHYISERLGKGV